MGILTFKVANVKLNGSGGTAIDNMESAALTVNMDMAETTSLGDTWKEYIALAKSWGLTVTAKYDNVDGAASALRVEFISGDCTVTSVTMFVNTAATTASFCGDTILTGFNVNKSVNAVDTYTVTFQGNGTLTYGN